VIQDQARGIHNLLRSNKVQYVAGSASLEGADRVRVTPPEGGVHEVPADRIILAPGSAPTPLASLPFDGESVISSNDALELQEIPETLLIVGAGVIGCEFAFIFSALGTRVILAEALPRVLCLPSVEADCSKVLQREMKKRKIQVMLNRTVSTIDRQGKRCVVSVGPAVLPEENGAGGERTETVTVDKVLVCIGRRAEPDDLSVEKAGVKTDGHGWIRVDAGMATDAPGVYAIGDILGPSKPMLAHVASAEAAVAAENAMGGDRRMDYAVVPNAIFTTPEIACVGLTEALAVEQGYVVKAAKVLFRSIAKAHILDEIAGEAKIVCDASDGRILGVHMIGPHATDLIGEGALAVRMGCTLSDLADTIHAHPTLGEIYPEVAYKALGRSLHG